MNKKKAKEIENALRIDYGNGSHKGDLIITGIKLVKCPTSVRELDENLEVDVAENYGSKLGKYRMSELKKKMGLL